MIGTRLISFGVRRVATIALKYKTLHAAKYADSALPVTVAVARGDVQASDGGTQEGDEIGRCSCFVVTWLGFLEINKGLNG